MIYFVLINSAFAPVKTDRSDYKNCKLIRLTHITYVACLHKFIKTN